MGHWLNHDPDSRDVSGPHLRNKNWFGINVGDDPDSGRAGEAGYFIEGEMWGGVIEYMFPHVSMKGVVEGLYQMPDNNTLRRFKDIGIIVRHPGDTTDTTRERISELSFICLQSSLLM